MNRKDFLALASNGALLGGLNRMLQAAPNTAAPTKDATSEKTIQPATLAVSIAVPEDNGERRITLSDDYPHFEPGFNVVICNLSDEPQSIWAEGCSWGYDNLSLEITAINGVALKEPLIVRKTERDLWFGNFVRPETLAPKESAVRVVHPSFPKETAAGAPKSTPYYWSGMYENFPLPDINQDHKITMRAVFAIGDYGGARAQKVYTGRIESALHEYLIDRR